MWRLRIDGSERNAHRPIPSLSVGVDACGGFKPGIPRPAFFMMGLVKIDVEIEPFALWRQFKLFVAMYMLEIGADKSLRYVPVPKLVRFRLRLRRRFQVQRLVGTDKEKIQTIVRPP